MNEEIKTLNNEEKNMSNFNYENLKKLRIDNHMTQEELAKRIFVSRSIISDWETNKKIPVVDNIVKLTEIFNVPINAFIDTKNHVEDILSKTEKSFNKEKILAIIKIIALLFIVSLFLIIRRYFIISNISNNLNENTNTPYIEKRYKMDNGQIKDYQVLDIVSSEDNVVDIKLYDMENQNIETIKKKNDDFIYNLKLRILNNLNMLEKIYYTFNVNLKIDTYKNYYMIQYKGNKNNVLEEKINRDKVLVEERTEYISENTYIKYTFEL